MTLADPPTWQYYLLESPGVLLVAILAVVVALMVEGLRQGRPRFIYAALGLSLLAGFVLALSTAITTPRQQLLRHTDELLRHTEPVHLDRLDELFTADLTVQSDAGQVWMNRSDILDRLDEMQRQTPISSHRITQIQAEARGDTGYVDVSLQTRVDHHALMDRPLVTRWLLVWKRSDEGTWRLDEARWLEFQLRTPSFDMLR